MRKWHDADSVQDKKVSLLCTSYENLCTPGYDECVKAVFLQSPTWSGQNHKGVIFT